MVMLFFEVDGFVETLSLDAVLSSEEGLQAQATRHPVESGSTISDHIIVQPKTLRLQGLVTATPLPAKRDGVFGPDAFSNALITIEGTATSSPDTTRPHSVRQLLRWAHARGALVTVGVGLNDPGGSADYHRNMVIETLGFPEDAGTGDALMVSMSLVEVRTVTSETVPLAKSPKAGIRKGGRKPTTKVDNPKTEQLPSSFAHRMFGSGSQ